MRSHWFASVVLLTACSTDSSAPQVAQTGPAYIESLDFADAAAEKDCFCFWSDVGFATYEECIAAKQNALTPEQATCIREAGASYFDWEDRFICFRDAAEEYVKCLPVTCDSAAFNECAAQWDTARGICPDPCAHLAGAELTACQEDEQMLWNAITACVN